MRFPEFTDEWTETNIGSILSIGNGKDYKDLGDGNIPVFGTGGYMTSVNDYLMDGESVFIGRKGTINKPSYYKGKFWTVDTLFYTHEFIGAVPRFVLYLFENIDWLKYNEASGVPSLSKSTIEKIKINIPKTIEQKKISAFISLLDRRIAVQSGLIEDLKNVKKHLMEQLFCQPKEKTPRLRLGGMSGEWKRVRLCDVVERVTTRNKTNECTRVLTIAAQYGLIDQQEFFNKQIASSDLTTYYLLHRGDFAYNKSYSSDYPWGAVKRLDNYDEGVLSSLYICFCPNHSIDSDFLRHYFESTKWYRGISEISGEGARNHGLLNMSVDDYFNTMHRFPSIEEQTCISHVLNTFDRKVLIEESILEKLRRQKSYLLNNMFI